MTKIYEKGTIKVVWIEDDREKIYSKMFDSEKEAADFGKTKADYLIFKLIKHKNMEEFDWEMLPYGKHKAYKLLFKAHKRGFLKIPGM